MRLYLIRHGQTDSNAQHLLDTVYPGAPLNSDGLAQAEALAELLAGEPIEAVYSSDLYRAVQTAEPLAARLQLPVRQLPGLREILAGVEEMAVDWTAYVETLGAWFTDPSVSLEGGEDFHTFFDRYDTAIEQVAGQHEVAAVVSHGAAIRVWLATRAENLAKPITRRLSNTDVVGLEGSASGGWRVLTWAGDPVED